MNLYSFIYDPIALFAIIGNISIMGFSLYTISYNYFPTNTIFFKKLISAKISNIWQILYPNEENDEHPEEKSDFSDEKAKNKKKVISQHFLEIEKNSEKNAALKDFSQNVNFFPSSPKFSSSPQNSMKSTQYSDFGFIMYHIGENETLSIDNTSLDEIKEYLESENTCLMECLIHCENMKKKKNKEAFDVFLLTKNISGDKKKHSMRKGYYGNNTTLYKNVTRMVREDKFNDLKELSEIKFERVDNPFIQIELYLIDENTNNDESYKRNICGDQIFDLLDYFDDFCIKGNELLDIDFITWYLSHYFEIIMNENTFSNKIYNIRCIDKAINLFHLSEKRHLVLCDEEDSYEIIETNNVNY